MALMPDLSVTKRLLVSVALAPDCGCPPTTAAGLQFSGNDVIPFQPASLASARKWIQIKCAEAADYGKDLPLFQSSRAFVKTGRIGQICRIGIRKQDPECEPRR